jgi:hypothetical protein
MVDCNQELSESDDLIPFSFLVTKVACVSWTICDTHTAINLIPTPMFLSLSRTPNALGQVLVLVVRRPKNAALQMAAFSLL